MDSGGSSSTSFKPFAEQLPTDVDNDDDMDIPFSAQFIQVSLQQLKDKLANVEHDIKSSLVYAQQVTSFVNDDHLLGFLYAENFDIDVSLELDCMMMLCCNVLLIQYEYEFSLFFAIYELL